MMLEEWLRMERRSAIALVLIITIIGGLVVLRVFWWGGGGIGGGRIQLAGLVLSGHLEDKEAQITSMRICGNSTDIVYPELMEADFVPLVSGEWQVTAGFVDDSSGYDEIETYERSFTANASEVLRVNTALYDGLSTTYASNDTIHEIMYTSMGFSLDIMYNDGSWISLLTMQDPKGHIILLSGIGPVNQNLLDGYILEPGSALESLVDEIHSVFQYHLEN